MIPKPSNRAVVEFRGIKVRLEGTFALKELPFPSGGAKPSDFLLDRWRPNNRMDKENSKTFSETLLDWQEVVDGEIFYGFEHLGAFTFNPDLQKTGKTIDFFDIVVIRKVTTTPLRGLKAAERWNPLVGRA